MALMKNGSNSLACCHTRDEECSTCRTLRASRKRLVACAADKMDCRRRSGLFQQADTKDGGRIFEAEIHLA
ncbi:hypothetical protein ATY79_11480 [Rhizobium sp. R693]|nr:hypothetical protein ATY79_11480 [Rhizobium sp. R693]